MRYEEMKSGGSFNEVTHQRYGRPKPKPDTSGESERIESMMVNAAPFVAEAVRDKRAEDAFDFVLAAGQAAMPAWTFDIWLAPLELVGTFRNVLLLAAPRHIATWVNRRYPEILASGLPEGLDRVVVVEKGET